MVGRFQKPSTTGFIRKWTSLQLNVEFGRHDCVDSGAQNPPDPRAPWNASHPSHCRERSAISTICKRHVFIRSLRRSRRKVTFDIRR